MKKSLFFVAAASALMLTACSSEDDILQTGQTKKVAPQEVGFDVYTPAATQTRAGLEGTMTTSRLQRSETDGGGFGVYAYLIEDTQTAAGEGDGKADSYLACRTTPIAPNFMVNEKVLWDSKSLGWYYNPLKYWPNETDNDSQNSSATMETAAAPYSGTSSRHLDRLTFFAYAPYVSRAANEPGITMLTNNKGRYSDATETDDPNPSWAVREAGVGYKASLDDPNKAVDLLWGVAPSGGLSYTAVNGQTVKKDEGDPLYDMTKPNVSTNMKFLFQHALARIGVTVVAAIDQVSPGGTLNPNTKITINSLKLTGMFGETGNLNLDNTQPNVANWWEINGTTINSETTSIATKTTLTLTAASNTIAPQLRYTGPHTFGSYEKQPVTGVTTTKQDLIAPSTKWRTKLTSVPAYSPATAWKYVLVDGAPAVATYTTVGADNFYTKSGSNYTAIATGTAVNAPDYPNVNTDYYQITEGASFNGYNVLSAAILYADETEYNAANGTSLDATAFAALTEEEKTKTPATYGYDDTALPAATKLYTKDASNNYTYVGTKATTSLWGSAVSDTYYTITSETNILATDRTFAYTGDIYECERNYFMVIPTNNVLAMNSGITTGSANDKALRTVRVEIEYYITTEDPKIDGGRTQTKNVITKDVLFPSMANGKSYNLNLVLGLTSVKMEAEVADWDVINVQGDLPQNTAE